MFISEDNLCMSKANDEKNYEYNTFVLLYSYYTKTVDIFRQVLLKYVNSLYVYQNIQYLFS